MSGARTWVEKTKGYKPEEPAPALHLVEKDEPSELLPEDDDDCGGGDWFDPGDPDSEGLVKYIAVKTGMGRKSEDALFVSNEIPNGCPWRNLLYWRGSRRHNLISLWFPGLAIEVDGENLRSIYSLMATRKAGVWQEFNVDRHREPGKGEPKIIKISVRQAT